MRPSRVSAASDIESFGLSPKGERALFVARGDVFTAPIEKGPTRNLTDSSNAHEKWATWSPDGSKILYISDLDGEEDLYTINQDGSGKQEELTHGLKATLYQPIWSPDGKRIAFSDSESKLYVLSLDDKKVSTIAENPRGRVHDYAWSADGGYLAYLLDNPSNFSSLYIWSAADNQNHRVTDDYFDVGSPSWDPEGNYLYFISTHTFFPQLSQIEFNYATNRGNSLYALALRKDTKNPFPPESDEVTIAKEGESADKGKAVAGEKKEEKKEEKKDAKKDEKKEEKKEPIRIDFDGLADRVTRVPVDADNLSRLVVTKGYLLYARDGAPFYGRESYPPSNLIVFSIKDRKETTLDEKIDNFSVSQDGSKVIVRDESGFKLYDAKPEGKPSPKPVATAGLMSDRVPHEEWVEIYNEVGRRYRDFFYVKNMNGYDWTALLAQYRPLVDYVAHRSDLNYVLGELVAELSVSHAYIAGGDWEMPKRPPVALPGARFELDAVFRPLPHLENLPWPESGRELSLSAHRSRCRRQGRRLRPRH